jgi:hypothetical protein
MVVAGAALFIALGGTGLAATGTVVNIADGTNAARVAHVNASGGLQVAGTVTAQLAAPVNYVHGSSFGISNTVGCVQIATAPPTNAMVIREVKVDVYNDPTPGTGQTLEIFQGASCVTLIANLNPNSVGQVVVPFDPGVAVPAGSSLSAQATGSVRAETYTDGYLVPSSQVPAAPVATITSSSGHPRPNG